MKNRGCLIIFLIWLSAFAVYVAYSARIQSVTIFPHGRVYTDESTAKRWYVRNAFIEIAISAHDYQRVAEKGIVDLKATNCADGDKATLLANYLPDMPSAIVDDDNTQNDTPTYPGSPDKTLPDGKRVMRFSIYQTADEFGETVIDLNRNIKCFYLEVRNPYGFEKYQSNFIRMNP